MPKKPEEHCVSESRQHSWAVVNLWLCNRLFWGYELTCHRTTHRAGLSLSHTQEHQGSLAGHEGRWLLNCQNPVSVLGKICQTSNFSVNCLGLMLCYFP